MKFSKKIYRHADCLVCQTIRNLLEFLCDLVVIINEVEVGTIVHIAFFFIDSLT